MRKKISALLILALPLLAFTAMTAFAAESPVEGGSQTPVNKSDEYRNIYTSDTNSTILAPGKEIPKQALGRAARNGSSPGTKIGETWYDYQRNGSMRRMVVHRMLEDPQYKRVHFVWMQLTSSTFSARKCHYYTYNPASGEPDCEVGLPYPNDQYAGYCVMNVTGDDRAIVGGHSNPLPGTQYYQSQFWWDDCPGCCDFTFCRVPDNLGDGCQIGPVNDNGFIWPAMCLQEGADTIMHVFAQEANEGIQPQTLAYFRTTNPLEYPCAWDYDNFYCVDTAFNVAQDCDCTDDGKVVITWTANLPAPGDCETCSSHDYWQFRQWDNDLYYQVSHNSGIDWDSRVNVTKNVDGVDGYRPYTDLSVLIDSRDSVHLVWNERSWPADANKGGEAGLMKGRISHWSEVDGARGPNDINVVHSAEWDQTVCNGGAWQLNASKMTISECDGKMYCLFVQFNDYNAVPPDTIVFEDCAVKAGYAYRGGRGRANGELHMCVSDDWGATWDRARNLTNSRTPACSLNCDNDNWPSMVKFGTNYAGIWPDNIVDPSVPPDSPYIGNWFLDVQYINDHSAGGVVQKEGWWAEADVKWFRLACVEPVPEAVLVPNPTEYDFPTWTKHGVQKDTTLLLENTGNCPLTYTITKFETTPPPGWLNVTSTGSPIAAGGSFSETVSMNVGGMVNAPGTIVHLVGSLYVDWQGVAPTCPPNSDVREVVPVECWVTDTLYEPFWDTIRTSCLALIVANTGNFGKQGLGHVNMDYVDAGDCDPDADVYLYDGSPVIGYQKNGGTDTVVNFSIFNTTYFDPNGFVPLGDHTPTTDMGDYEVFETGKFVTNDSLIAVEMVWYAPRTDPDTCSFVIQCMKIYLNDTLAEPPTDVRIAEAIDWDIPADTGVRNYSGFDYSLNLLWQQGSEEDGEGCQPNDMRWGGMDFLEVYKNGVLLDSFPYGGYIKDNATQVYPEGGFNPDSLYKHMATTGFVNSDTQNTDLHMVMIKVVLDVLVKGDTIVIYEQKLTHWNGTIDDLIAELQRCKQWYKDHIKPGCCNMRGDVNDDGAINVADLGYLVNYLFFGGDDPPCLEEGDVNGDGAINVADLGYLVNFLFFGGPPPPPC